MFYRRLCTALNDYGILIPADDKISAHGAQPGNPLKEYFTSIYKYNQKQFDEFQQKKSVAGVTDVVIDRLVFDFDGKQNGQPAPQLAHNDTIELCNRLIRDGFDTGDIRIFFSGASGFHVETHINEDLTVDEFKAITKQLSNGLETYDSKVTNPSRIFRAIGSVNKKTGLYKIPLTLTELKSLSVKDIQEKARSLGNIDRSKFNWKVVDLPSSVRSLKRFAQEFKPQVKLMDTSDLTMENKPKFLSNCRFALQNGHFGAGERNNALLTLAASYKNLGFEIEHTYRLLKAVAEKQSNRRGQDRFSDSEIWVNIIKVVYSDDWKGGQFTCREKGNWLYDYCQSIGEHKCKHSEDECFIEIDDFATKFTNFAQNIDKNTLKLGVPQVDNRVMITTSMLVGLLGAPSGGKTSLLLNFLEQSNKDGIDSVFFSMDMGLPLVYLRLIQKHFGIQKERVFDMFLNNPAEVQRIIETIKDKYRLTKFSFKTGMTVEGMKNAVLDHQEKTGRKVKLIGVDYLECIHSQFSDPTASTGLIANQLKDIANDLDTCVMLLLQTQKQSGDPSDPLLSMRNVKGSSVIEQACSVILSLSRPGFSPTSPENDRFATISTVKDRMGSLMSIDCGWRGLTGSFLELEQEDEVLLEQIRTKKAQDKAAKEAW